jgi:hypothetical protein
VAFAVSGPIETSESIRLYRFIGELLAPHLSCWREMFSNAQSSPTGFQNTKTLVDILHIQIVCREEKQSLRRGAGMTCSFCRSKFEASFQGEKYIPTNQILYHSFCMCGLELQTSMRAESKNLRRECARNKRAYLPKKNRFNWRFLSGISRSASLIRIAQNVIVLVFPRVKTVLLPRTQPFSETGAFR